MDFPFQSKIAKSTYCSIFQPLSYRKSSLVALIHHTYAQIFLSLISITESKLSASSK